MNWTPKQISEAMDDDDANALSKMSIPLADDLNALQVYPKVRRSKIELSSDSVGHEELIKLFNITEMYIEHHPSHDILVVWVNNGGGDSAYYAGISRARDDGVDEKWR